MSQDQYGTICAEIAHLTISIEPTPLLEKVSSYGLLPRPHELEL